MKIPQLSANLAYEIHKTEGYDRVVQPKFSNFTTSESVT